MSGTEERDLPEAREQVRLWLEGLPPVELPDEGELLAQIFANEEPPP